MPIRKFSLLINRNDELATVCYLANIF